MVQTKTAQFDINSSSRLRQEARKYQRPAPPASDAPPAPAPRINLAERMDLPSNIEHSNALRRIIDVTPDTRYILYMMVFYIMKLYDSKKQEPNPLLTPASFVAYCLFQLYGFLLVNDYHGRPNPSFYASEFMDNDARTHLFDALKESYVPPFMMQIFHGLTDVIDPRRNGLQYFATLAGSRFQHDFGRLMYPLSFLQMHNYTASTDTSRNAQDNMHNFLASLLFRAYTGTRATDYQDVYNAHLFSTTPAGIFQSHLYNVVATLFSPVTGKSLIRRTNIEAVILRSTPMINVNQTNGYAKATNNMYIHMLNANGSDTMNITSFIQDFSNIVKNEFDGKFQLGAVPDDMSGLSILNHGYSLPALPTWHSKKITLSSGTLPTKTILDPETYATERKFLQPAPKYAKGKDIPWPSKEDPGLWSHIYLTLKGHAHDENEEPDDFIEFNPEHHESPRCFWLQPYTEGDQTIFYSMISGLIIESAEIDGSSVPMPDTTVALKIENGNFLQGSLPIVNTMHAYVNDQYCSINVIERYQPSRSLNKISIDLYNMAQNRLPQFDADVEDTTDNPTLPGFNIVQHVRKFALAFSKLSFVQENPTTTQERLVVWSPYRFVTFDNDAPPTEKQIYMIFNFRTMYGTHIPASATEHPNTLIPIS
jgi:hypothetical protein